MTLSDLYRKVKGVCECLSSADVPLKCNGNNFNIDFQVESKDAIVSHIEVKQYLALTWEDVAILVTIYEQGVDNGDYRRYNDVEWMKEYSQDIFRKFNEQRKK